MNQSRSVKNKKISLYKLTPLCLISELVGLSVPNLLNYKGLPVLYIVYVILLLCGLIFTCIESLIYKITNEYPNNLITCTVLDMSFNLLMLLTNFVSLNWAIFIKRKQLVKFIKKLKQFDESFEKKLNGIKTKYIYRELILMHCVVLIYLSYGNYTILNYSELSYRYYLCINFTVNFYFVTVTVLQVYYFAACLKVRLYILNEKVDHFRYYANVFARFQKNLKPVEILNDSESFLEFLKCHNALCTMINLLNNCYGWQIFCIILTTIIAFLNTINICLKYLLGTYELDGSFGNVVFTSGMFLVIMYLFQETIIYQF